jgi:hypothetical protein
MVDFGLNGFMRRYEDYSRAYLFKCWIHHLRGRYFVRDQEYLVKSTKLPETTIGELETDWQGNKYKIASTEEFQDFAISFKMDKDDTIRHRFMQWTKDIHDAETGRHGNPINYFSDITLEHLNGQGRSIMKYVLVGAWPKAVGEVTLDYSSKEVASFDVTFTYQYHYTTRGGSGINIGGIGGLDIGADINVGGINIGF